MRALSRIKAAARASAPIGARSFNQGPMAVLIGARPWAFQLSFGQARDYLTGTLPICGQTAANSASSSWPPAFFGVSERQPEGIANGWDGL